MSAAPEPVTGVTPYITVSDASAASAFYQRAFGAEELLRHTAQDGKRLMHCHLRINGGPLMMSDAFPEFGHAHKEPQAYALHLQVDDIDAWWKRAVGAGVTVVMPMEKQFWGDRYGQVRDPFGVMWSLGSSN